MERLRAGASGESVTSIPAATAGPGRWWFQVTTLSLAGEHRRERRQGLVSDPRLYRIGLIPLPRPGAVRSSASPKP